MTHNNCYGKQKWVRQFPQKTLGIILFALVLLILTGSEFAHGVTTVMNSVIVGNIPPAANDDVAVTNMNTPVDIDVVANDTDTDGTIDPTTVVIASNPANGAAGSNGDGTVTYTPDAGFTGTDSFTSTVRDNEGAVSNEATVMVTVVPGSHVFTAYNDLSWSTGQVDTMITLYTTGQSGLLKDYFTGTNTPVTLTIAGGYIDSSNTPVQGSNANSGTDAYTVFNGIVNSVGLISYSATNLTFTFTGLDPSLNYEFVLFGNRDNTSYTNRMTTTTISDIVSFTNASTPVAIFSGETDPAVTIVNGDNTVNGYVARFTNINPGTNGDILITVSSPTGEFYANVLMLRATQLPDTAPPEVSATSPVSNATGVAVDSVITVTFNEAMDAGSITPSTFLVSDGSGIIGGTVSYSGTTATFTPSGTLAYSTTYTATVTTGVTDLAGNAMPADYTWSFTTGDIFDTTPPEVIATNPVSNATGVAVDSVITATFNEAMDAGSITSATFLVSDEGGTIGGTVSYNGTTATFTPSGTLAYFTTYTATVTTGVRDLADNAMAADYIWSFTTSGTHVFTAYNDLSWSAGQVDTMITLYTTGQSGLLKDYFTGTNTPVTLTIDGGDISHSNHLIQGSSASSGTDAYTVFNGIVNNEGLISYRGPNLTFTFTGLDPSLNYEFVLFGNRDNTSYTSRMTTTTISDVVSFTNASTAGAVFSGATDPVVTIVNGYNTDNGYVARFNNTNPGADGDILITVSSPTGQFYANALMLRATQLPDTAPPEVDATNPGSSATGVSVDATITVTFNEAMDAGSITPSTFLVSDGSGTIGGTVSYSGTTATFTPSDNLVYSTTYTATVTTGVTDLAGNAMPADYTWSFTTTKVWIKEGDEWRYFKGVQEPTSGWNHSGFDDSSWQRGPSGFGYGRERNRTNLEDMRGNYLTVYVRRDLVVNDPNAVTNMTLSIECDGPFIAYLNGREIIRNVSGLPDEQIDVSGFIHELFPGENILAVEGSNDDINSDGFSFTPEFELTERLDK